MNDEDIILSSEPLPASDTDIVLDILNTDSSKGYEIPQKREREGKVTFNPNGCTLFTLAPHAAQPDPLASQPIAWDLYLVIIPFTLHRAPEARYFQEVTFFIELDNAQSVAFDLFPKNIVAAGSEHKAYALSDQCTFQEIDPTAEPDRRLFRFSTLHPSINAFGEGDSTFYWIFKGSQMQKEVLPGTKHALLVLKVPHGTTTIDGKIRYDAVTAYRFPSILKTRNGSVEPFMVHWDLQDAQPFARPTRQAATTNSSRHFDVCIVCAMAQEARAVLDEISRQEGVPFKQGFSHQTHREYRTTTIYNNKGEPLTIHVSWQPTYGPVEAGLHLGPILREFQPRFVAMTGICAGDRSKVHLGDIVVAERAFSYDAGKILRNQEGESEHLHDADVRYPPTDILNFVRMFDGWKPAAAGITRPQSALHTDSPLQPGLHIAPMASGNMVRSDSPFKDVRVPVRGTIAIDMEGAAFYRTVADFPGIRSLLVKGVSDYADPEKDDIYHDYAQTLSASYILQFIKEFVTLELMPQQASNQAL